MNLAPIERDHFIEAAVHDHEGFNDDQGTRRAVEPTGTEASEIASQGRMKPLPPAGTTPSHSRATFSDPVADDIDPTSPESPEQTLSYQHEARDVVEEDWRRPRWDDAESPEDPSIGDQ